MIELYNDKTGMKVQKTRPCRCFFSNVMRICGVFGACRRTELHDITMDNVEDTGKELFLKIPETKTDVARSLIIANNLYDICKRYMVLRSTNATTSDNFL